MAERFMTIEEMATFWGRKIDEYMSEENDPIFLYVQLVRVTPDSDLRFGGFVTLRKGLLGAMGEGYWIENFGDNYSNAFQSYMDHIRHAMSVDIREEGLV